MRTLVVGLVFALLGAAAFGAAQTFKTAPVIVANSIFVSAREMCEVAGAGITWEKSAKRLTITSGQHNIVLTAGEKSAQVDGTERLLPVAPYLDKGVFMMPVRLAEGLGGILGLAKKPLTIKVTFGEQVIQGVVIREKPVVKFTRIADFGAGADSWGEVAGTVSGVKNPEQYRIVLYAITDMWYVQPWTISPITKISQKGAWKSDLHLGYKYAALLVREGYQPDDTRNEAPAVEGDILAITIVPAKR